jgi:hypothetical protein
MDDRSPSVDVTPASMAELVLWAERVLSHLKRDVLHQRLDRDRALSPSQVPSRSFSVVPAYAVRSSLFPLDASGAASQMCGVQRGLSRPESCIRKVAAPKHVCEHCLATSSPAWRRGPSAWCVPPPAILLPLQAHPLDPLPFSPP